MPAPSAIPHEFLTGPFATSQWRKAGLSPTILEGRRFRRLLPRVWVHVDVPVGPAECLLAAQLCLPDRARVSHLTRLQVLGWDSIAAPFHFTIAGELHLDLPDVVLHRTKALPPSTPEGVRPAAAWIQTCSTAPRLECIARGDWLLHNGHATLSEIAETVRLHRWRPGALQARRICRDLDQRSASPQESRLRSWCQAGGLPRPRVNAPVLDRGRQIAIVDLLFEEYRLVVEYEGRQHREDPRQFARDVQRYADLRAAGYEYVQVTAEMLRHPQAVVLLIHQKLCARGYAGPSPVFGSDWRELTRPIVLGR